MTLQVDSGAQAVLDSDHSIKRHLVLLALGEGNFGFWDGLGEKPWNGNTYNPFGLHEFDNYSEAAGVSEPEFVIRLRANPDAGLTPDVLRDYKNYSWFRRRATIYQAILDPHTYFMHPPYEIKRGRMVNIVEIEEGQSFKLEVHIETISAAHSRRGHAVRNDLHHKTINATDGIYRHAADAKHQRIEWGYD